MLSYEKDQWHLLAFFFFILAYYQYFHIKLWDNIEKYKFWDQMMEKEVLHTLKFQYALQDLQFLLE